MRTQNITNIADFRANLAKYFDLVHETGEPVVVVRHGEDQTVVMSGRAYDELKDRVKYHPFFTTSDEEKKKKFQALTKRIQDYWKGENKDLKVTPEDVDRSSLHIFDDEQSIKA